MTKAQNTASVDYGTRPVGRPCTSSAMQPNDPHPTHESSRKSRAPAASAPHFRDSNIARPPCHPNGATGKIGRRIPAPRRRPTPDTILPRDMPPRDPICPFLPSNARRRYRPTESFPPIEGRHRSVCPSTGKFRRLRCHSAKTWAAGRPLLLRRISPAASRRVGVWDRISSVDIRHRR